MFSRKTAIVCAAAAALGLGGAAVEAATVTGNPVTDGLGAKGYSLSSGNYVKGDGNYGYQTYGSVFTVQSGSNLEISDGGNSWLAGDTVMAVGGVFDSSTNPGWVVTGNAINGVLGIPDPNSNNETEKLQAKFGTTINSWSTSTIAPNAGNGNSSSSNGGNGTVVVRSKAYTVIEPWDGGTPWSWSSNSGTLLLPQGIDFKEYTSDPGLNVARYIYNWNGNDTTGNVTSWEILLNTSLLGRTNPTFTGNIGQIPDVNSPVVMTVQRGDLDDFTDTLVTSVPEPSVIGLLGIGAAALLSRRRRRA